jgi:uncharacterized metal-binding protein YceD (DUF177 family)
MMDITTLDLVRFASNLAVSSGKTREVEADLTKFTETFDLPVRNGVPRGVIRRLGQQAMVGELNPLALERLVKEQGLIIESYADEASIKTAEDEAGLDNGVSIHFRLCAVPAKSHQPEYAESEWFKDMLEFSAEVLLETPPEHRNKPGFVLAWSANMPVRCGRCGKADWLHLSHEQVFILLASEAEAEQVPLEAYGADYVVGSREFNMEELIEEEVILTIPWQHEHPECAMVADGLSEDVEPETARIYPFANLKDKLKT